MTDSPASSPELQHTAASPTELDSSTSSVFTSPALQYQPTTVTTDTNNTVKPFPPFNVADVPALNIPTEPVSLTAPLRIMSFNVNSLRALLRSWAAKTITLGDFFALYQCHIICIQETKLDFVDLTNEMTHINGYDSFWSCAQHKRGVSGTVTYVRTGLCRAARSGFSGVAKWDCEGRCVVTEFDRFALYNCYFPNGGMSKERLQYKLDFYAEFTKHVVTVLASGGNVIVVGDVNTAHNEIDLHNPKTKSTGFLPIERVWLDSMIDQTVQSDDKADSDDTSTDATAAADHNKPTQPFIDSFRYMHGDRVSYTYWDQKKFQRPKNQGWRIDFALVSKNLKPYLTDCTHQNEVMGSDHCPLVLTLNNSVLNNQHTYPTPDMDARNIARVDSKNNKAQRSMKSFFTAQPSVKKQKT